MSAMKPDAWMDSNGVCYTNKVSAEYYGCSEPLFTLATIRKWLEEEPSEAIWDALHSACDIQFEAGSSRDAWEAMLAAKLREMEDGQ